MPTYTVRFGVFSRETYEIKSNMSLCVGYILKLTGHEQHYSPKGVMCISSMSSEGEYRKLHHNDWLHEDTEINVDTMFGDGPGVPEIEVSVVTHPASCEG